MYVLAPNQTVESFPYSIGALRRDNPNTSFPRNPSDAVLADWNVFPVTSTPQPTYNHKVDLTQTAIKKSGSWIQQWIETPTSAKEIEERSTAKAAEVRAERNQKLDTSDWTQLANNPLTDTQQLAWAAYRDELREIPEQPGFPWDVQWPVAP